MGWDWEWILGHPAWDVVIGVGMVVATVVLAVATILLMFSTRKLAKAANSQTTFLERKERPALQMTHTTVLGEDGSLQFGGFMLTNIGVPAVTVIGANIFPGIPVEDTKSKGRWIGLSWTTEHEGTFPNFEPPHRLLSGDRVQVLYGLKELRDHLRPGQRIQYRCQDTFGNTYVSRWIDCFKGPHSISAHESPGKGFREPTMAGKIVKADLPVPFWRDAQGAPE